MKQLRFEYRIVILYLLIGGLWILFSDKFLYVFTTDAATLSQLQTYKGWFYVIFTAVLFFLFLKKHLHQLRTTQKELDAHKLHLQKLVDEKTENLDIAIQELRTKNEELQTYNELVYEKNEQLQTALLHLQETQAHLLEADKMASLGILTAGIAHEINNPLNYIMGSVSALESKMPAEHKDAHVQLMLDTIKTGVLKASSIVSGLQQLSKKIDVNQEECSIHSILDNCLIVINAETTKKIHVEKKYAAQLRKVSGNVGQLHQLFLNVLINSIQAIDFQGNITVETIQQENHIQIVLSDTGCGISPANMSKITNPFFTTKDPGKGTGLGLSIAYNIVQSHGGTITFKSVLHKGTTVVITIPCLIA